MKGHSSLYLVDNKGRNEQKMILDKSSHIQKIKYKCVVFLHFWCKGTCVEYHDSIFDVLGSS
ncbi:hypothetical protein MTR67_008041 [Solanum verrucosum]|uniref:Uncharacterized protein n=1 Tax=Solanum verrucosum TaxID=315347 RepID=A0AAF0Q0X9_SOLVR|nr:hypothetical protein MTR67_008041 [Solanum verrucosum]